MESPLKVVPGVYQLAIPMPDNPLGYLLAYLIEGKQGYIMIDTGWSTDIAWNSLQDNLKQLGISINDIKKILLTHNHPDHIGLAGKIKQQNDALVYLHMEDAKVLKTRYENVEGLLLQVNEWLMHHGLPKEHLQSLAEASMPAIKYVVLTEPDIMLKGGERIPTALGELEAVWTPGHAPGETCFYLESEKILFSGDHILPGVSPNIGLHPQSMKNPLLSYFNSLEKVEKLDVNLVLPGHEHSFENPAARIKSLREHHYGRIEQIAEKLSSGAKNAYEITSSITWGVGSWDKLSDWDRRMALMEVVAHLEFMKYQKTVIVEENDEVNVYKLAALRGKSGML